jgi:hypothetical protein
VGLAVEWRQTALVYSFGILASEDRDEAKRRGAERPTRLDAMSVYGTKLPWPMPDHPFGMGGHSSRVITQSGNWVPGSALDTKRTGH